MARLEQTQEQKKNLLKEKNDLLVIKSQLKSKLTGIYINMFNKSLVDFHVHLIP